MTYRTTGKQLTVTGSRNSGKVNPISRDENTDGTGIYNYSLIPVVSLPKDCFGFKLPFITGFIWNKNHNTALYYSEL